MKKFALIAAALAVAPSLTMTAPVFADSPGQLSNATTNYEVKNVTTGGAYGQSANATCNETVRYSVLLANSDFGKLTDLTVSANLASGAINASAKNTNNETTSVSGSVDVNVAKGSLNYVAGSTVRVSSNGQARTALNDGVTAGGVNAGELEGSTQTFVQFDAKVACETTETPVTPTNTTKPQVKSTNTQKPAVIAATGPASTIATMTGLSALAASIGYFVQRRRNILG